MAADKPRPLLQNSYFKAHLKSHQMFHMCTFCERIFTAKTKLRDHLAIDHKFDCSADDIFICAICEKKHISSNDLNEHLHLGGFQLLDLIITELKSHMTR